MEAGRRQAIHLPPSLARDSRDHRRSTGGGGADQVETEFDDVAFVGVERGYRLKQYRRRAAWCRA
jgi:hypothetical protein